MQQTATCASLQVDAALLDLEFPLKLDPDGNGQLRAREVKAACLAIDDYVKSHVQVLGCALSSSSQTVVTRDDAAYASPVYAVACVQAQPRLSPKRSDTSCSKTSMPITAPPHASNGRVW